MDTKEIMDTTEKYYLPVFGRSPIALDHGEGVYLYDTDGNRYTDFLAGIAVNLLFAIVVFVVLFSVIGFDVQLQSGEVTHMTVDPGRAIVAGFTYIGMVAQAVAGLFNPATAAQTVP